MDLGGRYRYAAEFQIERRAGVVQHGDCVAEVRRGAYRCIDAHVAHGTDDDQFPYVLLIEQALQRCFAEGVDVVLDDDRLTFTRRDLGLNQHAIGAGRERRFFAVGKFVTDVDDRDALGAGIVDHPGGVGDRGLDARQGQLARRGVFVLQVDDDDGSFAHAGIPLRSDKKGLAILGQRRHAAKWRDRQLAGR